MVLAIGKQNLNVGLLSVQKAFFGSKNMQKSPYFGAIKNYKLTYLDNEVLEAARTTRDSKIK